MSKLCATRGRIAVLGVVFGLLLPAAGSADEPGVAEVWVPPACEGEGTVGQVVALSGAVTAQAPGRAAHSLACDDAIRACDRIASGSAGKAGILVGDVYLELAGDSAVRVGERDGAPEIIVESGGVRVIDGRPASAPPLRIATIRATASGAAADAEVRAGVEPDGPFTLVCTHEASLALAGEAGATLDAGAGSCARADAAGLHALPGAEPSIEVAGPLQCEFEPNLVAQLLSPGDVAAPFGTGFPGVGPASSFGRSPCDDPGSGCAGNPRSVPRGPRERAGRRGPVFVVPPPGSSCGAPGVSCGNNNPTGGGI
jgi:hypothetical protein